MFQILQLSYKQSNVQVQRSLRCCCWSGWLTAQAGCWCAKGHSLFSYLKQWVEWRARLLSTTKFFRVPVPKSYGIIFNFLKWRPWKPIVIFEKENKNPLNTIWIFLFSISPLVLQKYFHGRANPSGYFPIVSLRINTIASRDQFKPIRMGENFLVNYDSP